MLVITELDVGQNLDIIEAKLTGLAINPTLLTAEEFESVKHSQDPSKTYAVSDSYIPLLEGKVSWPN